MSFRRSSALLLLAALLAAGCVSSGGGGAEPPGSPTPVPSPSPTPGSAGPEGRPAATSPAIAFLADGALQAVWIQDGEVFSSVRSSDGHWSADTVLDGGGHASAPVLRAAGAGAIAAWSAGAGGIFAARFDGSAWSAAVRVSGAELGPAGRPDLAVDGGGHGVLVWWQRSVAGSSAAPYAADGDGASWSAAVALDAASPAVDDARVALGAAGDGAAVWRAWDGTRVTIRTAIRASGHWSAASRLDTTSPESYFPAIATGADGTLVAAWSQGSAVRAARLDGAWSAPVVISDSSSAVAPAAGGGTVVWQQESPGGETEIVSRSSSGGSWSAPVVLAPQRALAPRIDGGAIAWRDDAGGFWLAAGGGAPVRLGGPSVVTELSLATSGSRIAAAWRDVAGLHVEVR